MWAPLGQMSGSRRVIIPALVFLGCFLFGFVYTAIEDRHASVAIAPQAQHFSRVSLRALTPLTVFFEIDLARTDPSYRCGLFLDGELLDGADVREPLTLEWWLWRGEDLIAQGTSTSGDSSWGWGGPGRYVTKIEPALFAQYTFAVAPIAPVPSFGQCHPRASIRTYGDPYRLFSRGPFMLLSVVALVWLIRRIVAHPSTAIRE